MAPRRSRRRRHQFGTVRYALERLCLSVMTLANRFYSETREEEVKRRESQCIKWSGGRANKTIYSLIVLVLGVASRRNGASGELRSFNVKTAPGCVLILYRYNAGECKKKTAFVDGPSQTSLKYICATDMLGLPTPCLNDACPPPQWILFEMGLGSSLQQEHWSRVSYLI